MNSSEQNTDTFVSRLISRLATFLVGGVTVVDIYATKINDNSENDSCPAIDTKKNIYSVKDRYLLKYVIIFKTFSYY